MSRGVLLVAVVLVAGGLLAYAVAYTQGVGGVDRPAPTQPVQLASDGESGGSCCPFMKGDEKPAETPEPAAMPVAATTKQTPACPAMADKPGTIATGFGPLPATEFVSFVSAGDTGSCDAAGHKMVSADKACGTTCSDEAMAKGCSKDKDDCDACPVAKEDCSPCGQACSAEKEACPPCDACPEKDACPPCDGCPEKQSADLAAAPRN